MKEDINDAGYHKEGQHPSDKLKWMSRKSGTQKKKSNK